MVFKRLKNLYDKDHDIVRKYPMYEALLTSQRLSNEDFYRLDDATCIYSFHLMSESDDPVLRDLAGRILERNLFEYGKVCQQEEYRRLCLEKGLDPEYYLAVDQQTQKTYKPYSDHGKQSIWVLSEDNEIKELSSVSQIVKSIAGLPNELDERVFFPKEILV